MTDKKTKMAALVSDWRLTSPLKPLNGMQRNLTGSKISFENALYQVCVFQADRKTKIAARPLIGLAFDFSSETAERNSTNIDLNQDIKVVYQVCVFSGR